MGWWVDLLKHVCALCVFCVCFLRPVCCPAGTGKGTSVLEMVTTFEEATGVWCVM